MTDDIIRHDRTMHAAHHRLVEALRAVRAIEEDDIDRGLTENILRGHVETDDPGIYRLTEAGHAAATASIARRS